MANCLKCSKPLAEPTPTGRPKRYCSMPCRRLGEAERRRIERELVRLQAKRSEIVLSPWGSREGRRLGAQNIDEVIVQLERRLHALYAEAESAE